MFLLSDLFYNIFRPNWPSYGVQGVFKGFVASGVVSESRYITRRNENNISNKHKPNMCLDTNVLRNITRMKCLIHQKEHRADTLSIPCTSTSDVGQLGNKAAWRNFET
jgi:hypothetical protein